MSSLSPHPTAIQESLVASVPDNDIKKDADRKPGRFSLKTGLKILISLGLLAFIFYSAGIDRTLAELSSANLWYIPVGVGIYLGSQLISSYRWQFLSRPMGFDLKLREFYDYYMMGMFFNLFLPGSIGGDVGRMVYLARSRNRRKREALLTLLAERGVGLVAILIFTGLLCLTPFTAAIPNYVKIPVLALSVVMIIGFIGLQVVPLSRLIERFPKLQLLDQARIYWQDMGMLVKSVAISMLVHGCMLLIHLCIAQALDLHISPLYLMAVYGIVSLASAVPIFFNGLGVREGMYQLLLQQIGVPLHTGLAFALYWFLISTLTSLVGGVILIKGHYKTPSEAEASLAETSEN